MRVVNRWQLTVISFAIYQRDKHSLHSESYNYWHEWCKSRLWFTYLCKPFSIASNWVRRQGLHSNHIGPNSKPSRSVMHHRTQFVGVRPISWYHWFRSLQWQVKENCILCHDMQFVFIYVHILLLCLKLQFYKPFRSWYTYLVVFFPCGLLYSCHGPICFARVRSRWRASSHVV